MLVARRKGEREWVRPEEANQTVQPTRHGFALVRRTGADNMSAHLQWGTAVAPRGLWNVEPLIVLPDGSMTSQTTGELRHECWLCPRGTNPRTTFDSGRA